MNTKYVIYSYLAIFIYPAITTAMSIDIEMLQDYLPPNPIIIEAGAHKGEDTINMAHLWPGGTIYAFEPLPQNYQTTTNTVAGIQNVKTFPLALSSETGIAHFYVGISNPGASSLYKPNEFLFEYISFESEPTQVQTITIDEWAKEEGITHVDFMWLDMEGGELDALKGAEKILPTVQAIYSEVNFKEFRQGNCFYHEIKEWLQARGFVETWKAVNPNWQGNVLYTRPTKSTSRSDTHLNSQDVTNQFSFGIADQKAPEPYNSIKVLPLALLTFGPRNYGWFPLRNKVNLNNFIARHKPMVVVQVGIWLGLSALYLADLLPPGGTMYAVDTWLRSEEEHTPRAEEAALLPRLYQQFLSNVIHQKLTHVVIPIRMQSLEAAAALDITPNLIYLDVEPNQKSVYNDLVHWYPKLAQNGILCGDDWQQPTVKHSIKQFINEVHIIVYYDDNFWYFGPKK